MIKKFDTFMFFNELDTLMVRLETLYKYVDYFVLCEADKTHLGDDKPYYYEENKELFVKYSDKIIHKKMRLKKEDGWGKENEQRYIISKLLRELDDPPQLGDLIFCSDLDEIWNPEMIRDCYINPYSFFNQLYFIYFGNLWSGKAVTGTSVCTYETLLALDKNYDNKGLQVLRNSKDFGPRIENGGWHYSYFGSPQTISQKSRSIAEGNKQNLPKTSPESIQKDIDLALSTLTSPYTPRRLKLFDFSQDKSAYLHYITAKHGGWVEEDAVFDTCPKIDYKILEKILYKK